MDDLYSFLEKVSKNSDFNAELCKRGGFITFSNSGKRGGIKYFQIGLDNILRTLKDILEHLDVFSSLTKYKEKEWRDNGSVYFTDSVANANSTVQTKPLFSTLSKVIIWGNQPLLNDVNPDEDIVLDDSSLKTAIGKLEIVANGFTPRQLGIFHQPNLEFQNNEKIFPLLTALRTKPFVLLAGISGTGKSRIVRELAKACWKQGDTEFGKNHPKNLCMVQVKPNWHDSSELIGYVSRINGEKYVVGPFLRFLAKAINDSKTPYFLCLDEMNLAPVEQYFAEYLSVIESRKLNADGSITTDPIIDFEHTDAYKSLIDQLFPDDDNARNEYLKESGGKRLTIPKNLFVVGTVNMDETTFSFSRKVLDRAMTIEMNEVDLHGGLDANAANEFGHIQNLIPTSVEGKDVYADNRDLCDKVLEYLAQVNDALDKTPFKIAYRTRNEFLVYAVNRGAENLTAALDEMTAMKILSRIEGDSDRTKKPLEALQNIVNNQIVAAIPEPEEGKQKAKSVSAEKITEMLKKLDSGYTSFWS